MKTIGDAVLLASPTPAAGLTLVRGLLEATFACEGFPVSRAGLHHGPAVDRGGDLFGAAVNLTARIAGEAAGGQVLASRTVAAVATELGFPATAVGEYVMKNVAEPVELWEVGLASARAPGSVGPVCRMHVDHARAAGRLRFADREYWFCSLDCASSFAAAPERFNS